MVDCESGVPPFFPIRLRDLVYYLRQSKNFGRPLFDDVDIGKLTGYISQEEADRILTLMKNLNLPTFSKCLTAKNAWLILESAKIHRNGCQFIPVPKGIGNCVFINDLKYLQLIHVGNQRLLR